VRTAFRIVLAGLVTAAFVFGSAGCGKDEGQPNPELKVPDVGAGGAEQKGKGPALKGPPRKK
jgi:hypothetical protein